MKRTPMPPRSKPLQAGKALARTSAFRRVATARTASLARSVRPSARKAKTRVGEFSPKTRRLAYERFEGRCARCGDWMHPKAFTCQHRIARGAGGSSDPRKVHVTNALAVHQIPCHEWIEHNPTEARDLYGYRVNQGQHPRDWPVKTWAGEWVCLADDGGFIKAADDPEERA